MAIRRHSFLVRIHEADGAVDVENCATTERVRIDDLSAVGAQISQWMQTQRDGRSHGELAGEDANRAPEPPGA